MYTTVSQIEFVLLLCCIFCHKIHWGCKNQMFIFLCICGWILHTCV